MVKKEKEGGGAGVGNGVGKMTARGRDGDTERLGRVRIQAY